jgi:Ca-activated chloride channel family protein
MLTLEFLWIFALLPLPLLIRLLWPTAARQDAALLVPFFNDLQQIDSPQNSRMGSSKINLGLLWLIWVLLLLSCARPTWIGEPINLPASGRDLLLAVDISGSMETADMNWNGEMADRLTTVKAVVGDFVERRQSDRLGLVLFGSNAYLQAPLTFDRQTVKQLLLEAQLGFAGEKTAIGDAIGLSVKRLRDRPEDSRVLILLTDGANTSGQVEPLQAASLAAQAKVKIYTIGIGADEMHRPGLFGSSFGSRKINPSRDLDEATLTAIAQQTGGRYFRARSPQDLAEIYVELDRLEPIEQEAEVFRPSKSLYHWPLGIAVLLSALMALLPLLLHSIKRLSHTQGNANG